jgi:hypothetical protein
MFCLREDRRLKTIEKFIHYTNNYIYIKTIEKDQETYFQKNIM